MLIIHGHELDTVAQNVKWLAFAAAACAYPNAGWTSSVSSHSSSATAKNSFSGTVVGFVAETVSYHYAFNLETTIWYLDPWPGIASAFSIGAMT